MNSESTCTSPLPTIRWRRNLSLTKPQLSRRPKSLNERSIGRNNETWKVQSEDRRSHLQRHHWECFCLTQPSADILTLCLLLIAYCLLLQRKNIKAVRHPITSSSSSCSLPKFAELAFDGKFFMLAISLRSLTPNSLRSLA